MGPAGSMEDDWETKDLCFDHTVELLEKVLNKNKPGDNKELWINLKNRSIKF